METKVTNKMIREFFGHNGHECKVRISQDDAVLRYGSRDPADRSADYWQWLGTRDDCAKVVCQSLQLPT